LDAVKRQQPPLVLYDKIILARGHEVVIPGFSHRRPDAALNNVLARGHVGGIDIHGFVYKPGDEQRMLPVVIGVPWKSIQQTERAPE
jgi:hypothetical protein